MEAVFEEFRSSSLLTLNFTKKDTSNVSQAIIYPGIPSKCYVFQNSYRKVSMTEKA